MKSRFEFTVGTITLAILFGSIAFWTMNGLARADSDEAANTYTKEEGDRKAEHWKALIKERLDQRNAHTNLEPGDSIRASFEERKIIDELDNFTVVEAEDVSLRDMLKGLAQRHYINIVFDQAAIEEAGLTLENKVNVSLGKDDKAFRLRELLPLLLDPEGLAYDIDDGALKITTPHRLEEITVTRAYAIPEIENLTARIQLGEHLTTLLAAQQMHRDARSARRREAVSVEEASEQEFQPPPIIKVFEDRVVMVGTVTDHMRLQELLRLIYLDL